MVANIELVKGDTLSFGMELQEYTDGLSSVFFSVKKNYTDKTYILQKTLGNGITASSNTEYVIRVAPEDTENLEIGQYYYDLQISANGDVFTVLRGILNLYWPVTDEGADEKGDVIDVDAIVDSLKSVYEKLGGTDDLSEITTIQDVIDKISEVIAG